MLLVAEDIEGEALDKPLREIVNNAEGDASVVINRIRRGKTSFGYNAQSETFGDLMEMGIIDPTKVVRCTLQNAASIAGLMITTEAMIAEIPEESESPGILEDIY